MAELKNASLVVIRRMNGDNVISIQTSKRQVGSNKLSRSFLVQGQYPVMPTDH
jgi:hypothetical protein